MIHVFQEQTSKPPTLFRRQSIRIEATVSTICTTALLVPCTKNSSELAIVSAARRTARGYVTERRLGPDRVRPAPKSRGAHLRQLVLACRTIGPIRIGCGCGIAAECCPCRPLRHLPRSVRRPSSRLVTNRHLHTIPGVTRMRRAITLLSPLSANARSCGRAARALATIVIGAPANRVFVVRRQSESPQPWGDHLMLPSL